MSANVIYSIYVTMMHCRSKVTKKNGKNISFCVLVNLGILSVPVCFGSMDVAIAMIMCVSIISRQLIISSSSLYVHLHRLSPGMRTRYVFPPTDELPG